jgi:hypothetical protein
MIILKWILRKYDVNICIWILLLQNGGGGVFLVKTVMSEI